MNRLLHVGCGSKNKFQTTRGFSGADWEEVRYDIDPEAAPDIVGSMIDMTCIESGSMDALFSSHNIEHLYPHEVPTALNEFSRVLKPTGFAVITCPDLQSISTLVASDRLTDTAYTSAAGPITALDMIYGHRDSIARGNEYMAHKCGFTQKVLTTTMRSCGFFRTASIKRGHPNYDLWVIGTKEAADEETLKALASDHFPNFS